MADSQAPATSSELHLRVKTLQPATYEIDTNSQATVLEVKEKLAALTSIPIDRQRLIFRGAVLQDTQGLASAHIEDGHTLHLVERPAGVPPSAPPGQAQGQPQPGLQGHRINIGMIDVNGTIAASGGMNGWLQQLVNAPGHQHIQMVTHPPAGNQEGAPQVVQMISMLGGMPGQAAPPHQVTALNNFLLHLDTAAPPTGLPPFSMVSRIGQVAADEAAFVEMARASLQGVELPAEVEAFVRSVQATPQEPQPGSNATDTPAPSGQQPQSGGNQVRGTANPNPRDPRRNGLDGAQNQGARPRPVTLGNDLLRLATLAVGQVARQTLRQTQAASLPAMAAAVNALQEQAHQTTVQAPTIQEQARQLSNATYDLGSLLLELSLATANLANAAGGNAGPLISAQTGFLAGDGTHAHITNRVPSLLPPATRGGLGGLAGGTTAMPAGGLRLNPVSWPMAQQAAAAQQAGLGRGGLGGTGAPGQPAGTPGATAAAGGPAAATTAGGPPAAATTIGGTPFPAPGAAQPQRTRGMDYASPLAHAYFNAITQDDETRSRHMRLPVRLADGSHFRIDLSPVVNAVETLILSAPPDVIARTLQNSLPVPMSGPENRSLRELMTGSQTDEQRRQIYLGLTQPILAAVMEHLQAYFQRLYRVAAPHQPGEEQAAIRPTRRAASRPVPSLTHPFAVVTNPARDILRTLPRQGVDFGGGQMQVDMILEGSMEIPVMEGAGPLRPQDMQAQMASMLQAAHRQQTQPGTQPLAPGAGPFGGAAASGVASTPQTGPHTAAHAAAAQARARDAQQQSSAPSAAARQPLSQEEQEQLVRTQMDRMAALRGGVTGPAGPSPPGQTSAGGSTQPPAAATISLGNVEIPLLSGTTLSPTPAQAPTGNLGMGAATSAQTAFGGLGMPAFGAAQAGAIQGSRVPLGSSGTTIDMNALSGMLGYPVMGPDGRTHGGRATSTPEQAAQQGSAASQAGQPTSSTAPSTSATATPTSPAATTTPPPANPTTQTATATASTQPATAAAALPNAPQPPAGTSSQAAAGVLSTSPMAGEATASAEKAREAGGASGGEVKKAEGKDGGRGLGSSLPSRKRTIPSGKDGQQAAPEAQQAAAASGPRPGSAAASTSAARDGKKQKLQDTPTPSSTDPGHPEVSGGSANPSTGEGGGATSSGARQSRSTPGAGLPLAGGRGGGLADMMSQMMQSPGLQEALQSPELEQMVSSPAIAQMMGSLFNPQGNGRQGEGGAVSTRQQGQGMPDMGALFQSMMPIAQQMLGGGASRPRNNAPPASTANAPSGSSTGSDDMRALDSLPEEDAQRWRNTIRADREKSEQDINPRSLSSNYLLATNSKTAKPSSLGVNIADLD